MSTVKPYAGYLRVSHVGRRDAEGDSFHAVPDQVATIERWASAAGQPVVMLERELDESGARADRPVLLQAVEGVERGDYAGIVVAYLSRASRNLAQMDALFKRVQAAGGHVIAVNEGIDTRQNGATALATRNMFGLMAQFERDIHVERFADLREKATRAGVWQRRQTPTGYRRDKATRRLVPDRRADEIPAAFRDFLSGTTISDLAKRLRMTPSGVRQLLRNRVYLGELRVGQHVNTAAHAPLIDAVTFEAVQRKLSEGPRPARRNKAPALLAGLVRCASCGHVMTRGNSGGRPVYICPGRHSGEACPRPASVTAARLDGYVEPIALAELARLQVTATEGDRVAQAQAKVAELQRALDSFLDAFRHADVDAEAVRRSAEKRQRALDEATEQLRVERARRPALPTVGSGADIWEKLNGHERNELLRSLLAAVVVEPAGRGGRVPLEKRVRVLAHGADVRLPSRRGGEASGIVPVLLDDLDGEGVLGLPASK